MDQMMPGMAEKPETAEKETCICIAKTGQGFEVGTHDQYMGESEGAEGQEQSAMQPAKTLGEALQMAAQMLQSDQRTPEEQIMAGYSKGQTQMPKNTPQQVFGE